MNNGREDEVKAIIQEKYGGIDVLQYKEVERPQASNNEILIKNAYTSVNYADLKKRRGNKEKGKFPMILGLDVAGTIEEAAEQSSFSIGDRVIAFPKNGSYSQYSVANEQLVFKIPDHLSFEQAAAMPTVSILSYILLHDIGKVRADDTIVIHSAAGGVGTLITQLAKLAGIKMIIGTVGNLDKQDYVLKNGANFVYTYDEFAEKVMEITNSAGANIIFDSVAGEITRRSLDCLAFYGTLVQFGNSSGNAGSLTTNDVHNSCRNIKGFSFGTTRKHRPEIVAPFAEKVIDLFANNKIKIPIERVFDLSEAAEAHKRIESRQHKGKVIIKIS